MKKSLFTLLAVVAGCVAATVGLTACGGTGSATTASSISDQPGGMPEPEGVVKVWDQVYKAAPSYTKAINQLDSEFEHKYPKVTVERIAYPEEGYFAAVRTAFITGEVPDVMGMFPSMPLTYQQSLEPLNDHLDPELDSVVTAWGFATPGYKEDGEHYGAPLGLNGAAFYYNKALFAKAGLPTNFHPTSWTEVREAGEKLKAAGIQPFADGDKSGALLNSWFYGLGMQTELTEAERAELLEGTLPYTSEAGGRPFGPFEELYGAGLYTDDVFTKEFPEGFAEFEDGKAAMVLGLWSVIGSYKQFGPKLGEGNLGMFPTPGAKYALFPSLMNAVPKGAKNKDAAYALLDFVMSKEGQETLFKVGESLPVRKDVVLPQSELKQGTELMAAVKDEETELFPLPQLPVNVNETLTNEFGQILQGRTSREAVQKEMQEGAEKEEG